MSKKTMVIVPTWDPDEPRFVVADASERISDDRKFVDGRCVENQRLGIVYSVEDIVYALNNSDLDKLSKENERLKKENEQLRRDMSIVHNKNKELMFENENLKHWNKCLAEKRHGELDL